MAKRPQRDALIHPRLIVCEGASDEAFFRALIKQRGLPKFCVRHTGDTDKAGKGGKSKYGTFLKGLPSWHGFYNLKSIIVVGDNDSVTPPKDDFSDIQNQIATALPSASPAVKYGVPPTAMTFEKGNPAQLAILMMPATGTVGCLESLLLQSAQAAGGTVNSCVADFVKCIGASAWPATNLAKFELRAHLSARYQKRPDMGLPYAWSDAQTKQLIPLSDSCFDPIASFLQTA